MEPLRQSGQVIPDIWSLSRSLSADKHELMPKWVEPADLQGCEHEAVEVNNDTNGSAVGKFLSKEEKKVRRRISNPSFVFNPT
jgi:hypothetical protein